MESSPDHRWLMQYSTVNLVNQCRRLIRAEFDENLSLTDPKLRFKLAHYAGFTRSQGLQRLYCEIRLALIKLEGEDPQTQQPETPPTRVYRGQVVNTTTRDIDPSAAGTAKKAVVYRGRAVSQA